MAKLSPFGNEAQFINGIPAAGALLFTYAAGSSTKQTTYTDEAGTTPQANPIVLNARGEPASPIWLMEGLSYKFVLAPSDDTDPPASPIRTIDDVSGVNDSSTSISQWVESGATPTYVNATQFTVPGDKTSDFTVNRRVKCTTTGGTVYGYISVSAYTSLTTVTVVLDSGTLDSGLSSVELGLITPSNTSLPKIDDFVTTAMIADDSVTLAKLAAEVKLGKVLQVVQGTTSTPVINSTAGFVATGLSATITPSSASSKILVLVNQTIFSTRTAAASGYGMRVLRDSTVIQAENSDNSDGIQTAGGASSSIYNESRPASVLDAPATTSAITYSVTARPYTTANSGSIVHQYNNSVSSIILMEIAA